MRNTSKLNSLKESVAIAHRTWIRANPGKTIGQLKEQIGLAMEQCLEFDPEETVQDYDYDIPEPLASELSQWDDPEATFGDREDDLEELANDLEALIEELGPHYKIGRLPVRR